MGSGILLERFISILRKVFYFFLGSSLGYLRTFLKLKDILSGCFGTLYPLMPIGSNYPYLLLYKKTT